MSRVLTIIFGMALALLCAAPASATTCAAGTAAGSTCFDLNQGVTGVGGNLTGANYYEQVALLPIGGSGNEIQVTVTTNPTFVSDFVATGNGMDHPTFAFDLASKSATITNITSGFAQITGACCATSDFGTFDYGINSTGKGNGAICPPVPGPTPPPNVCELQFDVTLSAGLTVSSFIASSTGYLFTSDILGTNGGTGLVAKKMPEPPTPLMFVAGLLGLMALRRRRSLLPARYR